MMKPNNRPKTQRHQVIAVQPFESMRNSGSDNNVNIETEHLTACRTIWNFINFLAYFVGVDMNTEIEMNSRLVFTILSLITAYLSLFYSMVLVWPNVSVLMEVICIFGTLLPVCVIYKQI